MNDEMIKLYKLILCDGYFIRAIETKDNEYNVYIGPLDKSYYTFKICHEQISYKIYLVSPWPGISYQTYHQCINT